MATLKERISNVFKKKEKAPVMSDGEGKILIKPSEESQFQDKSKVQVVTKAPVPTTTLKEELKRRSGGGGGSAARVQLAPEVEQRIVTQRAETYEQEAARKAAAAEQLRQGQIAFVQKIEQEKNLPPPLIPRQSIQGFGDEEKRKEYIEQQKEKKLRTRAITDVPGQYVGTIFDKKLSPEQQERATSGGFVQRFGTFLDPTFQYDVAYYNRQVQNDLNVLSSKEKEVDIAKYNIYQSGITEKQLRGGEIFYETEQQKVALEDYNKLVGSIITSPSYQRVTTGSTMGELIATADISEGKKYTAGVAIGSAQAVGYLIPGTRVILGADIAKEGVYNIQDATTTTQKLVGVGQIALGGIVAGSGLKSIFGGASKVIPKPYSALRSLGTRAKYAGTTALIGYGSYKKGESAFEQTGSLSYSLGVGVGTGVTFLIPTGVGYLRETGKPIIQAKEIKAGSLKGKDVETIGVESKTRNVVTDIYGKQSIYETTYYPTSKSAEVLPGKAYTVTTERAMFWNKLTGGRIGKVGNIWGGSADKIKYDSALNYLKDYGYSESAARNILRYTAPRYIETERTGFSIIKTSDFEAPKISAEEQVIIRQPRIEYDTGSYTRGARTIKDIYQLRGVQVGEQGGYSVTAVDITKTTGYLTNQGNWYNVISQAGKTQTVYSGISLGKAGEVQTATKVIGTGGGLEISKQYNYQTLRNTFIGKQTVPAKEKLIVSQGESTLVKANDIKDVQFDIRQETGFSVTKTMPKITKPDTTPVKFTSDQAKDILKTLKSIYGTTPIKSTPIISAPTGTETLTSIPTESLKVTSTSILGTNKAEVISRGAVNIQDLNKDITGSIGSIIKTKPSEKLDSITKLVYSETIKEQQKENEKAIVISSILPKSRGGTREKVIEIPAEKEQQKLIEQPTQKLKQDIYYPFLNINKINKITPPNKVEKQPRPFGFKLPKASQPTTKTGKYPVLIRRFGKFKIIGYGKTPKQALAIGKSAVGTTLARTFKVPSFKGFKVAGFKTKKSKKEGIVFIEPSARALSTRSEQKEIKLYKQLKFKSNVRR